MAPIERPTVLLVDDDDAVRDMMTAALERNGFEVVAAAGVGQALRHIVTTSFDALITDLHMPNAGDGFTVVTAMRDTQPNALTLLVSGYPDVQSATAAILLQADEIIVKPFEVGKLAGLVHERLLNRKPAARVCKERVGEILQRCIGNIVENWLVRAKQNNEMNCPPLCDEERTGHLPKLVEDLALRLGHAGVNRNESNVGHSLSAMAHGKLRYLQGYTPAMLVHESRMLQVTIFETLQTNLNHLDFSLLLPDVMTIADEVDSQLTQSMSSYMKVMEKGTAA